MSCFFYNKLVLRCHRRVSERPRPGGPDLDRGRQEAAHPSGQDEAVQHSGAGADPDGRRVEAGSVIFWLHKSKNNYSNF